MAVRTSELEQLRRLRTPIVYDALERLNLRPKTEGYTDATVRSILPALGSFVGFARTGKIACELPPASGERVVPWIEVWRYVEGQAGPTIAVVQDLDSVPGRGCVWGDVSASIFKAQGCIATVTNGAVRDIRDVEAIGFGLFAGSVVVGHGYGRFVELDTPVKIGGIVVHPGDLIHADEHGVLVIPKDVDAAELLRLADHVVAAERKVIEFCRRPGLDLDELDKLHTWSMETER